MPLNGGEHLVNLDLDVSQQESYLLDEKDSHGLRKLKQLTVDDVVKMYSARSACPEVTVKPSDGANVFNSSPK